MSLHLIQDLSLEAFAALVERVGFSLELEDFEPLIEGGYLLPLEGEGQTFCALQLFGLQRYMEAVRSDHHPWLEPEAHPPTDEARHIMAHLTMLANRLREGFVGAVRRDELEQLALDIKRSLEATNPLGPLAVMLEWLRPEVAQQLSGELRLWVELARVVEDIEYLVAHYDENAATSPMGHASVSGLTSRQLRTTQDMNAVDKSTLRTPSAASQTSTPAEGRHLVNIPAPSSVRVTAEMEAVQPTQAAPEGELQEGQNPFDRVSNPSTSNNTDLQHRLEALRNLDGKRARGGSLGAKAIALAQARSEEEKESEPEELAPKLEESAPEEVDAEEPSAAQEVSENIFAEEDKTRLLEMPAGGMQQDASPEPPASPERAEEPPAAPEHEEARPQPQQPPASMAQKIQQLNQKREAYMREQNWDGLIRLYEEGIELFESQERQQVHLTLAKLYELKLGNSELAFENMTRAFELGGPRALREKILEAMRRSKGGGSAYASWLESSLQRSDVAGDSQELLQVAWAKLLKSTDPQRAFFSFASYIADRPSERTTPELLAIFDSLGEGVGDQDVDDFYEDMLEQVEHGDGVARLASHVGMRALDAGNNTLAMHALARAYRSDPSREQLYHILTHLYEEEGAWAALSHVHALRLAHEPEQAEALHDAVTAAYEKALEQPNETVAYYTQRLEEDATDVVAREQLLKVYVQTQRGAEAYAFLNRHLELLDEPASRVQVLKSLASLAQEHLHAPEEAIVHLEEATREGGPERDVLEHLLGLQLDIQHWSEVARVVSALVEHFELEPVSKIPVLMAGAQSAHHLKEDTMQRHYLEQVLALDPEHGAAQQALSRLS